MLISIPFLSRPSCVEAAARKPMRSFCGSNVAAAPIAEVFRNSLLLFISCASCLCGNVLLLAAPSQFFTIAAPIDLSVVGQQIIIQVEPDGPAGVTEYVVQSEFAAAIALPLKEREADGAP